MAAKYPSFTFAAADDLACPICFQFYVNPHEPKNLPKCSHMCCSLCLRKMTEGGLKTVKCPQCNKVSNLPEEGVDGLITCLTVRNLAEKHPEGIKQRKEHMLQELEQQTHLKTEKFKETMKSEQQIQASIDQEVREVEKAVETMMTQAQDMIQQIRDLGQPKLTETRQVTTQLEQELKVIEQSQRKLKTMTDGEFQTETDALVNQIEKLKINELTNRQDDISTAKFVAQDLKLGRIVKPWTLEQVHEFGRFECACGIASKPDGTLAVSDAKSNPPQVHVYKYDNAGYEKQLQFNIEQAKKEDLIDIAVSADDKFLLTKESPGFEIYSSDGKYQKTIKVTTDPKQNAMTCSITTTTDGRILVGSGIIGEGDEPDNFVITVHDTAGKILKTIPIGIPPIRIADIRGKYVAVTSYLDEFLEVCVYNLETGKENLNLDIPLAIGVCHDKESDCLLIGRATEEDEDGKPVHGSCVIEQYCCMTGKLVAVLAHGLVLPAAMTITQDGMLTVADMKTVKVFKMK